MTRKTKAISGASLEVYFRRLLSTLPDLPETTREALLARLRQDVAQMRIRSAAQETSQTAYADHDIDTPGTASAASACGETAEPAATLAFDPFALNVIVTLRQQGRDAALEALNAIANAEHLRLLAREQRLSIDDALASSRELSDAIVTAAERRLANRRAAANAH